jgi:hypothetical protein
MDAPRPLCDAERSGLHSHAERGNDLATMAIRFPIAHKKGRFFTKTAYPK